MRRFVWSKKVKTIAEGLELTLRDHVYPNCKGALDRDKWRRERLYTQSVSNTYNKHLNILRKVYDAWGESVDEALIQAKDGSMSYAEWTHMMLATGLIAQAQTTTRTPAKKPATKAKRFGGKKRVGSPQKEKRLSSLRKKRMAAKQKRAIEEAEAEADAEGETEGRYWNKLMKLKPLSEQHIRTSFIFSQMWVKNHNTTIKHKRMTFTDFLEGVGRVADAAYLVTKLPKTSRSDRDDSGSSSEEDDDDDDIDLSIKLEDLLPKFIFPLVDKATKVVGGR